MRKLQVELNTGQLEVAFHAVKSGMPIRDVGRTFGIAVGTVRLLLIIACTKTSQLRRKSAVSKDQERKLSECALKFIFGQQVSFAT